MIQGLELITIHILDYIWVIQSQTIFCTIVDRAMALESQRKFLARIKKAVQIYEARDFKG